MSRVLTQQLDTSIDTIVKGAYASFQTVEIEQQQVLTDRELHARLHRRKAKIYQRRDFRWHQKRLELGMQGLRTLLELGQSGPIQRLIKLNGDLQIFQGNGTGFCFYYADSAREDAPDSVAVYFTESGLSLWAGCVAACDFAEIAFFDYTSSEEESRALLSPFVGRHTDEAFEMLDQNAKRASEWWNETHIVFQVVVDCGDSERLPVYIDAALKNYLSVLRPS